MDEMELVGVELSKINFLLENLYAVMLRNAGADAATVNAVADELRRQITDLPAREYGPGTGDTGQHTEMVAARLDTFFAGVQARLSSSDQGR